MKSTLFNFTIVTLSLGSSHAAPLVARGGGTSVNVSASEAESALIKSDQDTAHANYVAWEDLMIASNSNSNMKSEEMVVLGLEGRVRVAEYELALERQGADNAKVSGYDFTTDPTLLALLATQTAARAKVAQANRELEDAEIAVNGYTLHLALKAYDLGAFGAVSDDDDPNSPKSIAETEILLGIGFVPTFLEVASTPDGNLALLAAFLKASKDDAFSEAEMNDVEDPLAGFSDPFSDEEIDKAYDEVYGLEAMNTTVTYSSSPNTTLSDSGTSADDSQLTAADEEALNLLADEIIAEEAQAQASA